MSVIYEKSVSDKYGKYFAPIGTLMNTFAQYSIERQEPIKAAQNIKAWDSGRVGVPIAWSGKSNTVCVDHTDTHTLVIGPTGSKKSRLIAMPFVRILASTGESMIISDPKAEIYNRTAEYLKQKQYNVLVLNLRSPMHGHRWNPLVIPYKFYLKGDVDKAYEFVNDIAENLIQTDKSEKDPFWDNSAGSFFFGLTLLLFKYCKEHELSAENVHIGNIVVLRNELLSKPHSINKLWKYAKTDHIIASSLIGTVETANDTKAGILSVFDQKIRMFSIQPNLMDMLGANDFELSRIGVEPTAVFLIVPDEKTGYHGLVSLFIKQSYEYMIFDAQLEASRDGFHTSSLKNRVNYLLDEFSSLPTIRDFPAMVTAARSRNIRFCLIIQSKHQLLQRYREETETIQTNCNNWIFLTSRELQFLEEVSSLCGKTNNENPQPILSVADLQRLDKESGEALLLCGRTKPCITKLADIEVYDKNQFSPQPVVARPSQQPPIIQIENIDNNKSQGQSLDGAQGVDVQKLINQIDKKIAELEQEEKRKTQPNQQDNQE